MDKSVAQKFMIVMSMITAMFATVFVCGSIVSSSVSTDGYVQPVPKTHFAVSYSDSSIDETPNDVISQSDIEVIPEKSDVRATTTSEALTNIENGVTVVEFVDDEDEDYTSETMDIPEEDIDNQFLYMTTVTTKLPDATVKEALTTTTVKQTKTTTTRKTTAKTSAVTAAKPYTTRITTTRTTTKKRTTTTTVVQKTTTTVKKISSTEKTSKTSVTTASSTTASTTTASVTTTTTTTTTTTAAATTTKATTTTSKSTTTTTTAAPTTTTTTTKAPQIGGAVSINKRTTTEPNEEAGQP